MAVLKRMYWDIETSPCVGYFWRPGRKVSISYDNILEDAKIICICWKWEGEDEVYSLDWGKKQDDRKLVQEFAKELMKADDAVAHNGDRFDLPWLKTRFLIHGVDFPAKIVTTDTLKRVRSNFRFPSNRLDAIGDYLGVGRKMDTGGFGLWKDVMLGDREALDKMVEYCKQDCVLLEAVHKKITNLVPTTTHHGVLTGGEKWSCPSCGSVHVKCSKTRVTAMGTIKRQMKCGSCNRYYTISNKSYEHHVMWKMKNK